MSGVWFMNGSLLRRPHLLVEDDARRHEQFPEAVHIDASSLRLRKVDAAQLQQLDAVLCVHVVRQTELPAARGNRSTLSQARECQNFVPARYTCRSGASCESV